MKNQDKKNQYLFDVDRKDLYLNRRPELVERTKKRLVQIAEAGMEEVGVAEFGVPGIVSGLWIEKVWSYDDDAFQKYMDWAIKVINEKKK